MSLTNDNCEETVRSAWGLNTTGTPMFRVYDKLKTGKKNNFGCGIKPFLVASKESSDKKRIA